MIFQQPGGTRRAAFLRLAPPDGRDYNGIDLIRQRRTSMYIADLHIHSRFSRATSKDGDLPHLDWWARRKGIRTGGHRGLHPPRLARRAAGAAGARRRRASIPCARICACRMSPRARRPRFVVTGEISCIYKRHGRTRKVHNLILLPCSGGGGRALRPAGGHRQHPLRRTAHSGAGQPGPAGADPGHLPGRGIHPRSHLDAPLRSCSAPSPALIPWRSASGI